MPLLDPNDVVINGWDVETLELRRVQAELVHNKAVLAPTGDELRARVKEPENSADEWGQRATGCWALRKRS